MPFVQSFQSTPPAWGATVRVLQDALRPIVSIHAPRVGGDGTVVVSVSVSLLFQSTPPAWGATQQIAHGNGGEWVSIHAPRVGGDDFRRRPRQRKSVSIHAPRVGGD